MSTRPRPRPRRLAAPPPSSPGVSPTTDTATPPPPTTANVSIDDEDALFIRNRNRSEQTWKKLNRATEEKDRVHQTLYSSDDEANREESTPRRRKYVKKPNRGEILPDWTKDASHVLLLLSSEEEDVGTCQPVQSKLHKGRKERGATPASNENRRRRRSRSRSITPPPALPPEALQHARETIRQLVGVAPRPASPILIADDPADNIVLDPELASIAKENQSQVSNSARDHTAVPRDVGGPPTVSIKIRWVPHPLNPSALAEVWGFKMNRHDPFQQLFAQTADLAEIRLDNLRVSYDNKRIYPSATPSAVGIWAEAELEACDLITYEYLQANRRQRSMSVQHYDERERSPTVNRSSSLEAESAVDTESEAESEQFRLTLRSGQTKDIVLTVRQSTTCGAIVKAFLKKAGLADQYPMSADGVKGKKRNSGPALMVDGDKLSPSSEIGDADLEDGDLVEVVGL